MIHSSLNSTISLRRRRETIRIAITRLIRRNYENNPCRKKNLDRYANCFIFCLGFCYCFAHVLSVLLVDIFTFLAVCTGFLLLA